MTPEQAQKRFDKLIAQVQSEIISQHRYDIATTPEEKEMAQINLLGAREGIAALLKKWSLYPTLV